MQTTLLRSQRNSLLRAIEAEEFSPSDFEWFETQSKWTGDKVPAIGYKPTSYYFVFDYYPGDPVGLESPGRVARYTPGRESLNTSIRCPGWNETLITFQKWLSYVRRETEPDLWDETEEADFRNEWLASNDPFKKDELKAIQNGLTRVESFLIENSNKSDAVIKDIKENVTYLKESAESSGRRDWMMMFIGIIVTHLSDWAISNISWQHVVGVLVKSATKLISGK